jgi:hypothetical protein
MDRKASHRSKTDTPSARMPQIVPSLPFAIILQGSGKTKTATRVAIGLVKMLQARGR